MYFSELYGDLDWRHDLKWRFRKETKITGVYDDFSSLAPDLDKKTKAEPAPIVRFLIIRVYVHTCTCMCIILH